MQEFPIKEEKRSATPTATPIITEEPPAKSGKAFVVIAVIFIIIAIVGISIFFVLRAQKAPQSQSRQKGGPIPSPTLVPNSPEKITLDIKDVEKSLAELSIDITVIDQALNDEPINLSDVITPKPQTADWEKQKIENLKARAELEIDRRVSALDKFIPKLKSAQKLSFNQKSYLINQAQIEIANLKDQRLRIVADIGLQILTTDIGTLIASYKIFAVLPPQADIIIASDKINVLGDSFTSIANRLQEQIKNKKSSGKDMSALEKTLGHMLFATADAGSKAESAGLSAFSVLPNGDPKNKFVLFDADSKIKTSRQDLQFAVDDAKNIMRGLNRGSSSRGIFFELFGL